jgi:hypothetical protein
MELLLETVASVSRNKQSQSASVYSHRCAPGGFSLFLGWDTASVPLQGSDTDMLIIEGFKPLGLLDHTVMVEKRDVKRKKPDGKQKPGHRR